MSRDLILVPILTSHRDIRKFTIIDIILDLLMNSAMICDVNIKNEISNRKCCVWQTLALLAYSCSPVDSVCLRAVASSADTSMPLRCGQHVLLVFLKHDNAPFLLIFNITLHF